MTQYNNALPQCCVAFYLFCWVSWYNLYCC